MSGMIIGLDLAKSVFQVHAVDAEGKVVITRKVRRSQMLEFFTRLVHSMLAMMTAPGWLRVLPAMLLLKLHQHDIAEVEQRMHDAQLKVFQDVLQRGVSEGRIGADDDPELLLTLFVGPILMAGLTGSTELNGALADRSVSQFLGALDAVAPTAP